tara:strand:- start:191 stop:472 length:282 start_codon:yes stop_codon:yes gene_type:complete
MHDKVEALLTERAKTHGDAKDTFSLAGDLIAVILRHKKSEVIEPHEFAVINIVHKLSRICCGAYHEDHWNDINGYAKLGKDLHEQLTNIRQEG